LAIKVGNITGKKTKKRRGKEKWVGVLDRSNGGDREDCNAVIRVGNL